MSKGKCAYHGYEGGIARLVYLLEMRNEPGERWDWKHLLKQMGASELRIMPSPETIDLWGVPRPSG